MAPQGRWDELFFADLPTREEREAIWNVQIAKFHREPSSHGVRQLAKATESIISSEIEQMFIEALYRAFEQAQEPTDLPSAPFVVLAVADVA